MLPAIGFQVYDAHRLTGTMAAPCYVDAQESAHALACSVFGMRGFN
jgi:hypothetical protein